MIYNRMKRTICLLTFALGIGFGRINAQEVRYRYDIPQKTFYSSFWSIQNKKTDEFDLEDTLNTRLTFIPDRFRSILATGYDIYQEIEEPVKKIINPEYHYRDIKFQLYLKNIAERRGTFFYASIPLDNLF